MTPAIDLVEPEHRYFLTDATGRRELLGVTRCIVESNLVDDEYFSEIARGRGKLVHLFAERILTDTLGAPVDASVLGFLIGLRKFLDKYAPTVHAAEQIVGHTFRGCAGRIDFDMTVFGAPAVVDVKTGSPSVWHGLQLAPYAYMLDGAKWARRQRFGLYLNERGGYRLKEYDDVADLEYFFRTLELLQLRCKHGSYERPYGRKPVSGGFGIVAGIGGGDPFDHDDDREWRDGVYGDSPDWQ